MIKSLAFPPDGFVLVFCPHVLSALSLGLANALPIVTQPFAEKAVDTPSLRELNSGHDGMNTLPLSSDRCRARRFHAGLAPNLAFLSLSVHSRR